MREWRRRASWQRLKECASLSEPFTELNIGAYWRELRGDVRRCAWILCGLSSRMLTQAVRRDHITKRVPEVASQLPNLYVRPRRPTVELELVPGRPVKRLLIVTCLCPSSRAAMSATSLMRPSGDVKTGRSFPLHSLSQLRDTSIDCIDTQVLPTLNP